MAKIQGEKLAALGRNEPCLCGSGKKYKKCCGIKHSENMLLLEQNQVFQTVLQDFFENHPRPSQQNGLLEWKNKTENLLVPLYGEDKSGGIIGDAYFFSEKVDIWNEFIEQALQQEQRPQIRQVLQAWLTPQFLAGEILSISNYRAQMRDLLSEKQFEIDVNESFPVEIGNIAFGFYVPDIRESSNFLMVLNSVTTVVDADRETIGKLKEMYNDSEAAQAQTFYRENLLTIYRMFSNGLLGAQEVPDKVLEAVQKLEQFLIEQDVKSDELIETFFHFLKPLPAVPAGVLGGAVHFGIKQGLLKLDWSSEKIAEVFKLELKEIEGFSEDLQTFYLEATAEQEKEAEYAFEIGTKPKANELRNWQLFMHLKNAAITSEASLKRQMEYYHAKPYEPKSDSEKAQLLAYGLFDQQTESLLPEQVLKVQQLDPRLSDGYLLAASKETEWNVKASLLKIAVENAYEHYEQDMEVPWLYIANRPYLRAVFVLGVHYWEQRELVKAFSEFEQLLSLNPGDHQGARYLAASSLIGLDRLDEAESLISHYEDEYSDNAFYTWFTWLIQRKRNIHSKTTQDLFLKAVEQNPYVKKHVQERPDALEYPQKAIITPRSPEEARLIWSFLAPSLLQ